MLRTAFHEQDEGMMPGMINVGFVNVGSALTGDIVWLNTEFDKIPIQKSKDVGEVHSRRDQEIPPRCNGVDEPLF